VNDSNTYLNFRALIGGQCREETFEGKPCLVAPVVALVGDNVITPISSGVGEFVPKEVLSLTPEGWNYRPVVTNHPQGGKASANDPVTLESMRIGWIFNSQFKSPALLMEAWIDTEKCKVLGDDALSVYTRLANNELLQISVGCFVYSIKLTGTFLGKSFQKVWSDLVPDHLAILPVGIEGACDLEMGCGTPRSLAAAGKIICGMNNNTSGTNDTSNINGNNKGKGGFMGLSLAEIVKRIKGLGGVTANDVKGNEKEKVIAEVGMSDSDLRGKLWDALMAKIPAFYGVVNVYPDGDGYEMPANTVIGECCVENVWFMFAVSYSLDGTGNVTIGDDVRTVRARTIYETVTKAVPTMPDVPATTDPSADPAAEPTMSEHFGDKCKCKNKIDATANGNTNGNEKVTTSGKGDETMATNDDKKGKDVKSAKGDPERAGLISALSAAEVETPEMLASLSTKTLQMLAKDLAAASGDGEDGEDEDDGAVMSEDAWLASAPESVRQLVASAQASERAERDRLTKALTAGEKFNKKELDRLDIPMLRTIASGMNLDVSRNKSYLGNGNPRTDSAPAEDLYKPTEPYAALMAKSKEAN
jgi:hypothetical protein